MNAFRCFLSPLGYVEPALFLFIHKKQVLEVRQPQPLCDHPGQKLGRLEHLKAESPSTHSGWWARAPAVALLLLFPSENPSRHKNNLLSGAACNSAQAADSYTYTQRELRSCH